MRVSAGLLLFREDDGGLHVLLGHMGGPLWARRNAGAWTIPKGEPEPGEEPQATALREFAEEIGTPPPDAAEPDIDLGEVRQSGGKRVRAWARRGDLDVSEIASATFELEWPPRTGHMRTFPELDRAAWFPVPEARALVVTAQAGLIDRLVSVVGDGAEAGPAPVPAAEVEGQAGSMTAEDAG